MKVLGTAFLHGLAAVLPIALTVYLIYLLAASSEQLMGGVLRLVLPDSWYLPGVGLAISIAGITAIGFLIRLPLLNLLVRAGDAVFSRIPLVNSVYTTIKDFMEFIADSGDSGKPVLVNFGDNIELVGVVTDASPDLDAGDDRALVYLPLSYQIGGYTALIPRDRLTPLDITVEHAMKFVMTAGVKGKDPLGQRNRSSSE